jgi:hypothetical protein
MRRMTVTGPARWGVVGVALGAGLLAVACGSGGGLYGGGGSPSGSPSAAAPAASPTSVKCQDAAALRASLDKLKHVNVGPGAGDEIKADLADVKEKLADLRAQSHGQWQLQISALQASLAQAKSAASDLSSNPSVDSVSGTVTALRGVAASASTLLAAVSKDCPSASASPSM